MKTTFNCIELNSKTEEILLVFLRSMKKFGQRAYF